jgi:hypothetical protein
VPLPRYTMEMSGRLHAPAAVSQGKSPIKPFERRLGGPQRRSGEEKNLVRDAQPIDCYTDRAIPVQTKHTVLTGTGGNGERKSKVTIK